MNYISSIYYISNIDNNPEGSFIHYYLDGRDDTIKLEIFIGAKNYHKVFEVKRSADELLNDILEASKRNQKERENEE